MPTRISCAELKCLACLPTVFRRLRHRGTLHTVRLASDPLTATARGAHIAAMFEK